MIKKNHLIFELTPKCNQDCLYCYNVWKNNGYKKEELPIKEYLKILEIATKSEKPKFVTLSGGEPLMMEGFFDVLDFFKRKKIKINLITNGTLLDDEIIKKSLESGVKVFELPILSYNSDIHDELTQVKGSHQKTVSAIRKIKENGGNIVVVIVLTSENVNQIKECMEFIISLDVTAIMLNRVNLGGASADNIDLMPKAKQLEKAFDTADKLAQEYKASVSAGIPVMPCIINTLKYKNINFGYCQSGKNLPYYAIDFLGNVRPCNHSSTIIGNLLEQSFSDILKSEKLRQFEKAHPKECDDCSKVSFCQGGCKASAEECFGNCNLMEPFLKENWKEEIKN